MTARSLQEYFALFPEPEEKCLFKPIEIVKRKPIQHTSIYRGYFDDIANLLKAEVTIDYRFLMEIFSISEDKKHTAQRLIGSLPSEMELRGISVDMTRKGSGNGRCYTIKEEL